MMYKNQKRRALAFVEYYRSHEKFVPHHNSNKIIKPTLPTTPHSKSKRSFPSLRTSLARDSLGIYREAGA